MSSHPTVPASLWQSFALDMDKARPGFAKGPWFTMSAILELDGSLDADVLATAFHELQQRHEILRTEIVDPHQLIHGQPTAELEIVDEVTTHAPVALNSPIRLRLAGNQLALHLHHLVSDPITLWAALSDLAAAYTATLSGESLPPPVAQYSQYSTSEAELVRRNRGPAAAWWRQNVTDAKVCPPPTSQGGTPFAYRDDLLSTAELTSAEQFTREHRSTPLVTLLAALVHGMNPHVGPGDTLVFETLFSKRDRPAWQHVLGPCIVPALLAVPRPSGSLAADVPGVRDAIVGCSRFARFPQSELEIDTRWPFFEYVPQQWPADYTFGAITGRVVAAAGPKDTGLADALAIRVRKTTDGVLTGHFSADGSDWTEPLVHQLRAGFRSCLLTERSERLTE